MSNSNSQVSIYKMTIALLTVLFIGLKLTNYISWSWWWVTAPLWGSFLLSLIVMAITFVITIIITVIIHRRRR